MATKKITDLVEIISAASGDVLPIVDISDDITKKIQVSNFPISTAAQTAIDAKQDTLVSGTNIKTLNSESLLGSGNIEITASPSGVSGAIQFSDGSAFASDADNLFWDDTNNRLGIGTNAPIGSLEIDATATWVEGYNSNLRLTGDAPSLQIRDKQSTNGLFIGVTGGRTYFAQSTTFASLNYVGAIDGGNWNFGAISNLGAKVGIKGSGSKSATTALLVQNSSGVDMMKITDDITTTIGNQFNIIRTTVPEQMIEINANFSTIAAGIRAGGNSKDFVISAKDSRDLYLSTNFATSITQVQFAVKHNIGVLIKDNASTTMDASARLEVASTTQGFLPPRMTTTQKNAISSPASGLMVYDTDTNKLCCYNGTSWNDLF